MLESIEQEKIDGEMTQFNVMNVNDNSSINQSLNDSGEFLEMIKERKYDILVTGHSLSAGICLFLGLLCTKTEMFKRNMQHASSVTYKKNNMYMMVMIELVEMLA